MSAQDRTALKALITGWPETNFDIITNHKPTEQHILDSVMLNRDVSATISATTSITSVNFAGVDAVTVNSAITTDILISGIEVGEVKYIRINKNAGNVITFSGIGVINMDINPVYCNTLTTLFYKIIRKESILIAVPYHKSFDFDAIPSVEVPEDWQEAALTSGYSKDPSISRDGIWFRKYANYLDLSIGLFVPGTPATSIPATLPTGYRPLFSFPLSLTLSPMDSSCYLRAMLLTDGRIELAFSISTVRPRVICGFCRIPLV